MSSNSADTSRLPLPALLEAARSAAFAELHGQLSERGYGDIRLGHVSILDSVDRAGTRPTDLARQTGHSKQAVGECVGDLEALGYVDRLPDPTDHRAKLVRLTPRGVKATQMVAEILAAVEREWADRIGQKGVAALREALERLYALGGAGS
ncbi:MAG: MarR family winged helix-turn-helix transcriptional regulator [Solirubrobacterales bacterium]